MHVTFTEHRTDLGRDAKQVRSCSHTAVHTMAHVPTGRMWPRSWKELSLSLKKRIILMVYEFCFWLFNSSWEISIEAQGMMNNIFTFMFEFFISFTMPVLKKKAESPSSYSFSVHRAEVPLKHSWKRESGCQGLL